MKTFSLDFQGWVGIRSAVVRYNCESVLSHFWLMFPFHTLREYKMGTLTRYGLIVQIQVRFNVLELFFKNETLSHSKMRPLDFHFRGDFVMY